MNSKKLWRVVIFLVIEISIITKPVATDDSDSEGIVNIIKIN